MSLENRVVSYGERLCIVRQDNGAELVIEYLAKQGYPAGMTDVVARDVVYVISNIDANIEFKN